MSDRTQSQAHEPEAGSGWERIRVEQEDGVTVVNLARPEKRNALDEATIA